MARLVIVECDTPVGAVEKTLGSYVNIFTDLLENGFTDKHQAPLSISSIDARKEQVEYPSLDSFDGILITGSKHTAYDSDQWIANLVAFTKSCLDNKKKIIGICFGHQIVGRALGLRLGLNDKGWEIGVRECKLTEQGKKLFSQSYGFDKDVLAIQEMHRDIVESYTEDELPSGVELVASTPVCANQGMYKPGSFITLQGHPEFSQFIEDSIIKIREKDGVFTQNIAEKAFQDAAKSHDGLKIGRLLLDLLVNDTL